MKAYFERLQSINEKAQFGMSRNDFFSMNQSGKYGMSDAFGDNVDLYDDEDLY